MTSSFGLCAVTRSGDLIANKNIRSAPKSDTLPQIQSTHLPRSDRCRFLPHINRNRNWFNSRVRQDDTSLKDPCRVVLGGDPDRLPGNKRNIYELVDAFNAGYRVAQDL